MANRVADIGPDTLASRLDEPDHVVVDIRPLAAYNGWRLQGEPRGGHVPGAVSLPLEWFEQGDIASILDERGPSKTHDLTVYGYHAEEVWSAVESFSTLGYEQVTAFTDFIDGWAADPDRPLERLARYEQLVYPDWVKEVLRGGDPPAGPEGDWVVCHVHHDNIGDYEAGHIPGAIPLNTLRLESPTDWNRRPPDELEATLLDHGIRHDTTVVLYGRPIDRPGVVPETDADPGHLGAMRCAVILLYAGVNDVRILNGGLAAWRAAGYELTGEQNPPQPVDDFGAHVPARPELIIDTDEARAWLSDDTKDLVSIRSPQEIDGDTSGYDYISERGHIPGAILVPSGSDANHVEPYRNADETMREPARIAAMWAREGVDRERTLAFSCGTGWRSSEAFMNAYLMGWTDIALYDGGWHEWSRDPENPIGGV